MILGATAVSLAGVSAYAMRPASDPIAPDAALAQVSNSKAKADRLAILVHSAWSFDLRPGYALPAIVPSPTYSLASIAPGQNFDDVRDAALPAIAALPSTKPPQSDTASAPMPPPKPKRPPATSNALLDDAQIAGLRNRLRLTSEQSEHWPAVETALREVVRHHFRAGVKRANNSKIDVNSPHVQRLIWAAMPLLRQLREDQKREVRQLVHVMGLGSVASHI
jgi:hypothetical protein